MNRTLVFAYVCAALAAFWPGVHSAGSSMAAAQPAPSYGGVTPGTNHVPEGFAATPGTKPLATWPGFQLTSDGGSRVFVQTTVMVKPQLKRGPQGFVLTIPGVGLPPGNARLPLDTHFFRTPVQSVHVKQQSGGVAITIRVRGKTDPKLRTERASNGYFFVYLDFAP